MPLGAGAYYTIQSKSMHKNCSAHVGGFLTFAMHHYRITSQLNYDIKIKQGNELITQRQSELRKTQSQGLFCITCISAQKHEKCVAFKNACSRAKLRL